VCVCVCVCVCCDIAEDIALNFSHFIFRLVEPLIDLVPQNTTCSKEFYLFPFNMLSTYCFRKVIYLLNKYLMKT
jgi:hypothetical protein